MIKTIVKKFIGSKNDREIKKLRPLVVKINELELELAESFRRCLAPKDGGMEGD